MPNCMIGWLDAEAAPVVMTRRAFVWSRKEKIRNAVHAMFIKMVAGEV